MKSKFKISGLIFLGLWCATCTLANDRAGNGGGSWVCRVGGAVQWTRLIDLYEAENEFHLSLKASQPTLEAELGALEFRLAAVAPNSFTKISAEISRLGLLAHNPAAGIEQTDDTLAVIDDALYRIIPAASKCLGGAITYEQVVNFKKDGSVLVQRQLFNSLSVQDRGALVLHEAMYAFLRKLVNDPNSVNTRRAVGLLDSTLSDAEVASEFRTMVQQNASLIFETNRKNWPFRLGSTGTPAANGTRFLSLFYDPALGAVGAAWNGYSEQDARNTAHFLPHSQEVYTGSWPCTALSIPSKNPNHWMKTDAVTRGDAETINQTNCQNYYGSPCELVASVCSGN